MEHTVLCENILKFLGARSGEKFTRKEIGDVVHCEDKAKTNRALYTLKDQMMVGYSEGTPPMWNALVTQSSCENTQTNQLHVIVDLGNCHDCLKELERYAEKGIVTVAAYADFAFRGYGVQPKVQAANVKVYQADTTDKNSADVQIIWDTSRIVLESAKPTMHIIVATKDLGFQRLRTLVGEREGYALTFVTNWEDLRNHIE